MFDGAISKGNSFSLVKFKLLAACFKELSRCHVQDVESHSEFVKY